MAQYNANCTFSGCHGASPDARRLNAANAGDVIARAVAQNLMADGPYSKADVAAYLATFLPAVPSADVAFGGSTTITFPNIALGETLTVMRTVTAPSKGSLGSYAGNTVTYTHDTCTTGKDTVAARGSSPIGSPPAASTSPRSVTVNIANPTTGPTITSATTATAATGELFKYNTTVSTCDSLVSWSLSAGAPAWLSVNSSGVVSGVPPAGTEGTSPSFTVKAEYPGGASNSVTVTVTISLGTPMPPGVTSPPTASGTLGVPFTYQITANISPTSFAATGLPPGLTVNTSSGLISGTPTEAGTFKTTVSAKSATETATLEVTITIASSGSGAPIAQDLTVDVPSGAATPITLPISGQFTQVAILTAPSHGAAATPSPGSATVVYTPDAGYLGVRRFHLQRSRSWRHVGDGQSEHHGELAPTCREAGGADGSAQYADDR